jgi:hypothetical protein
VTVLLFQVVIKEFTGEGLLVSFVMDFGVLGSLVVIVIILLIIFWVLLFLPFLPFLIVIVRVIGIVLVRVVIVLLTLRGFILFFVLFNIGLVRIRFVIVDLDSIDNMGSWVLVILGIGFLRLVLGVVFVLVLRLLLIIFKVS